MEYSIHSFLNVSSHGINYIGETAFARPLELEQVDIIINTLINTRKKMVENQNLLELIKENQRLEFQASYNKPIKKIINEGFVYIAICNHTKYYKIGRTKNVKTRIVALKMTNPTIELIESIKVKDMYIEKELHKKYIEKKVSGEWFRLTETDVKDILEYLNNAQ